MILHNNIELFTMYFKILQIELITHGKFSLNEQPKNKSQNILLNIFLLL